MSAKPCNCTTGYPCLAPGDWHRRICPLTDEERRDAAADLLSVPLPERDSYTIALRMPNAEPLSLTIPRPRSGEAIGLVVQDRGDHLPQLLRAIRYTRPVSA